MYSVLLMAALAGGGSAPACDDIMVGIYLSNRAFEAAGYPVPAPPPLAYFPVMPPPPPCISFGPPIFIAGDEICDDGNDGRMERRGPPWDRRRGPPREGRRGPQAGADLAKKVDVLAEKLTRIAELLALKIKAIEDRLTAAERKAETRKLLQKIDLLEKQLRQLQKALKKKKEEKKEDEDD
jgi:hypothetical protein